MTSKPLHPGAVATGLPSHRDLWRRRGPRSRASRFKRSETPKGPLNDRSWRNRRLQPQTAYCLIGLVCRAGRSEGVRPKRPEARTLLRDLTEHATQPEFVYRHRWRTGDLVMWDDRTTITGRGDLSATR